MRLPSPRPAAMPAEMLPILNVVLLLLVFFVMLARVTAPVTGDAVLPRSSGAVTADAALPLLQLGVDGRLQVDGLDIAEPSLRDWLRGTGATQLRLQAHAQAPAARVLATLTLLRAAGAQRVQLLVAHQP